MKVFYQGAVTPLQLLILADGKTLFILSILWKLKLPRKNTEAVRFGVFSIAFKIVKRIIEAIVTIAALITASNGGRRFGALPNTLLQLVKSKDKAVEEGAEIIRKAKPKNR